MLDLKEKTYIFNLAKIKLCNLYIHSYLLTEIKALKINKISIMVLNKYKNFVYVFLTNLTALLLKYIRIKTYNIKLIDNYKPD